MKDTGKVREICQSEEVGTMIFVHILQIFSSLLKIPQEGIILFLLQFMVHACHIMYVTRASSIPIFSYFLTKFLFFGHFAFNFGIL